MKRAYDRRGALDQEAITAGRRALPLLQQAYEMMAHAGYKPREAQAVFAVLLEEQARTRVEVVRHRRGLLDLHTPEFKRRALALSKPNRPRPGP